MKYLLFRKYQLLKMVLLLFNLLMQNLDKKLMLVRLAQQEETLM